MPMSEANRHAQSKDPYASPAPQYPRGVLSERTAPSGGEVRYPKMKPSQQNSTGKGTTSSRTTLVWQNREGCDFSRTANPGLEARL